MENFIYDCKTKIIFGRDTELQVGEETKKHADKILLHYGKDHIKKSGLYNTITESLTKAGVAFIELGGVVPNPRLDLVQEGIELCRKEDIKFILAIGGGSVIDSAKAIAAGVPYDGDVWDFYTHKATAKKALAVATVLTIAAAGSEASGATVINKGKRKRAFSSVLLKPVFSILNPELTTSCPPYQTAAGITDMMAHIFERYFTNSKDVDVTDKLCEGLLRSIIKNAPLVMKNPDNYDYRAEIMLAGKIAHDESVGVGRIGDWGTHMIEHELSAYYDITHGAGLAVIFPAWMKYVYRHDVKQFVQFTHNVWEIKKDNDEQTVFAGIKATRDFFKSIGMPTTLKDLDISDEHFEDMAQQATQFSPIGNFVQLTKEDVIKIYQLAR